MAEVPASDHRPGASRRKRLWIGALAIYLCVLLASHAWQFLSPETPLAKQSDRRYVTIPVMRDGGPLEGRTLELAYLRFRPEGDQIGGRAPVILLHGSPGNAGNFTGLGRELALRGYESFAPDLPGFGGSVGDVPRLSLESHARSVLAMMDALGIDRAHVAAWSQGGGVALYMADIAPDRVASLGLIASIGAQRTEGSGSYWFEHAKYALAYAIFVIGPELIPDFGAIPHDNFFAPFARNFLHSDQRPLERVMRRTEVPILIVHGRHDFLLSDRAALVHHTIAPTSSLLMLDAGHFIVSDERTIDGLTEMFARHDAPGIEPERVALIFAEPRPAYTGLAGEWLGSMAIYAPWWVTAGVIALAAIIAPWMAFSVCALSIGVMRLDFAVGIVGLTAGLAIHKRPGLRIGWWIGIPLALSLTMLLAIPIVTPAVEGAFALAGPLGGLVAVLAFGWIIWLLLRTPLLFTRRGRARLAAGWGRFRWHEYWPTRLRYGLLIPTYARLTIKHRGPLVFTSCNPGIGNGGGVAGESKREIMDALEMADEAVRARDGRSRLLRGVLDRDHAPPHEATEASVRERTDRIDAIIEGPVIGGYPAVIKPEAGQNGAGVTIVRGREHVLEHLKRTRDPLTNTTLAHCGGKYVRDTGLIIQQYHPGPHECGLLWLRFPDGPRSINGEQRHGAIYSVADKKLPVLVGDGRRSLEELIWAHPRHRCQAGVLIAGLGDRATHVARAGERVEIGRLGNHCRGAIFTEGAHLITDELERIVDLISHAYPGPDGAPGGLDVGRYDLRYESDDGLKRGEFVIIELNGVTGESANCYDPNRSLRWSLGVMSEHWSRMYALGAKRRAEGWRPLSPVEIIRLALARS
jgi:pimeloyl-ACP methyl ester carboxylesterase